jgi:hypothetical protein
MHFSFESLAITCTLSLQAFLMNIHHDTFLGLFWKTILFFQHLELAFVFVQGGEAMVDY